MDLKTEIKNRIKELEDKKWKNKSEEDALRLVEGHLNPDRVVDFGTFGMLDVYENGRFDITIDVLKWVLSLME